MNPLQVAVGIVYNSQNQILVAQRHKNSHLGETWEFPGGKFESGEDAYQALCRELKEEIDIQVNQAALLTEFLYDYDGLVVHLHIWCISQYEGQVQGVEGQLVKWVSLEELASLPLPGANQKIVALLENDNGHNLQQVRSN